MPEPLEADLQLTFDSAVAEVESALNEVFERAASSFADATSDAVTSAIDDLAASTVEVPIDADTGEAEAALDDLAALADASDFEASVDADTSSAEDAVDAFGDYANAQDYEAVFGVDVSEAESALESVQSQAEETSGSVGGLGTAASGFQASADLATGSAAGLGSAIGDMSQEAGLATGIVAAGAAAVGVFFGEALDAESVTLRFRRTLGDFAAEVDQINVGDLNTDISTLAIRLGSSDEQMRRAATNAFLFATNSGIARKEAAGFSEQVLALSARAVALNPDLGDVGDAAQTLQRALVTGRERALLPFNLGLDKTEVAARASAIALANGRTEASGIDKAMAGAQLASEKLGGSLKKDIDEGAKNPTIRLRSLKTELKEFIEGVGAPLVSPVFDLLRAGVPAAEAAGAAIGRLAQAALPTFTAVLNGLVPILTVAADLLEALPAPVLASVGGFLLMSKAVGQNATGFAAWLPLLSAVLPLLTAIDPAIASGAIQIGSFALAGSKLGQILPNVTGGMGTLAGAGVGVGQAIGGQVGNVLSFASSGALLGQSLIPIPGVGAAAGAAVGALGGLLLGSGQSAEEAAAEISKLSGELKDLTANEAAQKFLEDEIDLQALLARQAKQTGDAVSDATTQAAIAAQQGSDALKDLRGDLRQLAAESPGAAENVVRGLRNMGAESGLTKSELAGLDDIVGKGTEKYQSRAVATGEVAARDRELADAATASTTAQQAAQQALESFVSSAVGTLPSLDAVLGTTKSGLESFGLGLDNAASPQAFLDNLRQATEGIVNFQSNVETLISLGLPNIARLVVEQGPQIGGAYAQALLSADPAIQQATERQLGLFQTATTDFSTFLSGPGAQTIQGGYQAAVQGLPDLTAIGMSAAGQALREGTPGVASAAAAAGTEGTAAYGTEIAGLGPESGKAVTAAVAEGTRGTGLMADAGRALGRGFTNGLAEMTPQVTQAGAGLANAAASGTRNTGGMTEAGHALSDAFAAAIRDGRDTAFAAGQTLAREAARGARNAGSPSEHLFYDAGRSFSLALGDGITSAASVVVAATQGVVRSGVVGPQVAPLPMVAPSAAPSTADAAPDTPTRGVRGAGGDATLFRDLIIQHPDAQVAARTAIREAEVHRVFSGRN